MKAACVLTGITSLLAAFENSNAFTQCPKSLVSTGLSGNRYGQKPFSKQFLLAKMKDENENWSIDKQTKLSKLTQDVSLSEIESCELTIDDDSVVQGTLAIIKSLPLLLQISYKIDNKIASAKMDSVKQKSRLSQMKQF